MSALRIMCCTKRTIDYAVKIRVTNNKVDQNVKHSMNPFDEIACEEAIRMRERNKERVEDIHSVSIGVAKCQDVLRTSLAMGVDRSTLVEVEDGAPDLEPLILAKILQKVAQEEKSNLIILGKQAIDNDCSQTGQMLAGLLDWPQAHCASQVEFGEDDSVTVTREVDGGTETLRAKLPMVITTDLRLNEPRYASLPNIMKAKKKPLVRKKAGDYGIDLNNRLQTLTVVDPPARTGGEKTDSVDGLIAKLKELGAL